MTGFRDKYKSMKDDLKARHKESVDRKGSGSRFGSIFLKDKIPKGRKIWSVKEARHTVDMIPFAAGSQHPIDPQGKLSYVVEIWVHMNIGVTNEHYVCPAFNFKRPCPVCEYIKHKNDIGERLSKEEWAKIAPKRRTVYLIWVHDSRQEEEDGLYLWEISWHFIQTELNEIVLKPNDGGIIDFSNFDDGKHVLFTREGSGADNTKYKGIAFEDRKVPAIPDAILNQSFPLDEVINMYPTYNEIHQTFYGEGDKKTMPEEKTARSIPKELPVRSVDKSSNLPQPVCNMENDVPFGGPEEGPANSAPEFSTNNLVCPSGHTFGIDIDAFPEDCSDCSVWDACADGKSPSPPSSMPSKQEETNKPSMRTRRRRL